MDAVTAVKLCIIAFEVTLAFILTEFMSRAVDKSPIRAMLTGAEILAFMVVATLPAPKVKHRGHRPRHCAA